jgi:hypothetical protein
MTTRILRNLLIAALFAGSAAFGADNAIQVTVVDGKQQAQFQVGDAHCLLVDDVIQCTPVVVASK